MIIRVSDIPLSGRKLEFDLNVKELNARVNAVRANMEARKTDGKAIPSPEYIFVEAPKAEIELQVQGGTVLVEGTTKATFRSPCSRCAEDIDTTLVSKLKTVLKPNSQIGADSYRKNYEDKGSAESIELKEEDLHFAFFNGKEVNCAELLEENLVLQIPFTVSCSEPSI